MMNDKHRQLLTQVLQTYLDSDSLSSDLCERNIVGFPIVKFVDLSNESVLKVLIGGRCAGCGMEHLINTCSHRFFTSILNPIITELFPIVQNVIFVTTVDPLLETYALRCGYTLQIMEACTNHYVMSRYQSYNFLSQKHPDVACCITVEV